MDGKDRIGEIRGVAKDQNIEPHFEDILSKKLKGFPDAERYQKRVKNTKMLTYVYTKYENDKPLTKDDIKFIYEIDNIVITMGWGPDPRLEEMQENRRGRKTEGVLKRDEVISLVRLDYRTISFVPKEMIDKEMVLEAVEQDCSALEYVLEEIIDKEIALKAVERGAWVLEYFPEEIIDKEVALKAVEQDCSALEYVPEEIIDKEVALKAVGQDGCALRHVPKEMIDKEMALKAVEQNGRALEYVPKEMIDKEMALKAVERGVRVLKYVPKEMVDKEMVLEAIKHDIYEAELVMMNYNGRQGRLREAILNVVSDRELSELLNDRSPKRR